jgi:hypothetical protein
MKMAQDANVKYHQRQEMLKQKRYDQVQDYSRTTNI